MKIKKEAIMATIIGLIIGLLITGGVLRAQRALDSRESREPTSESSNSNKLPEEATPGELELLIEEPEDNLVVGDDAVTITGTTQPGTYIAIITEKNEYLIVPNEVGQFSQEISLVSGANTITISVYDESGNRVEKTLNIVYTSAEI